MHRYAVSIQHSCAANPQTAVYERRGGFVLAFRFQRSRKDKLPNGSRRGHYLPTLSQLVAAIRPPSHHLDPLIPEFSSCISAPQTVTIDVGQLPFDRIGVPKAAFVQHRGCRCAEPVACHVLILEAHAPQRGIQCVLRHAPRNRPHRRKQELASSCELPKFLEDQNRARCQWNAVRFPHLIRSAGISQTAAARSNSVHWAARNSPGRTKVRASSSRAARVSGAPS